MTNAENNTCLEIVPEEEAMRKEDVLNFLIAIGVNTCNRSYDTAHKEMKDNFLAMSLKEIAPTWEHLDDNVKISIITIHADEFKVWVNNG